MSRASPRQRLLRVGARPAAVDVEADATGVADRLLEARDAGQVALRPAEPAHQLDDPHAGLGGPDAASASSAAPASAPTGV